MGKASRFLGSLAVAVPLLVSIAAVLAWGTIYETRFGTASVQRFVYQSWWFQALLAFLAVNLAAAALSRRPWKRRHVPFLLAHLGIISVLAGGILGGRLGVQGQMIIPEGQESSALQLQENVLAVRQPNPGIDLEFPTRFDTTSWVHQPHALFEVPLGERTLRLVVDRYYPNAESWEEVTDEGEQENPAVHLLLSQEGQEDGVWLFARDPDRFGARWGGAHVFLFEPGTAEQARELLDPARPDDRGAVRLEFPDLGVAREIPVPARMNEPAAVEGTPYRVTFKEYFPDFALSEKGPVNRSSDPNNPAVALTVEGPEGIDAHLLFALHPEFAEVHGRKTVIHSHLQYRDRRGEEIPPDSIGLVLLPGGGMAAVLTDEAGARRKVEPLLPGVRYAHPGLGYGFEVTAVYPRAKREARFANRDDEVRREAVRVTADDGRSTASAWLLLRDSAELAIGPDPARDPLTVEYRPAVRPLPFSVRLLDFRKIDYPGLEMAAAFEADVELADPERGITMRKKISMNNPLKYRGYSLFQSSFVQGPVETTVLSVRNDPGVPLVYAGFLIIVAGVAAMFILRPYRRPAAGA